MFNPNTRRDQVAVNLAKIKTHLNGTTRPLESFMKNPHRFLLARRRKASQNSQRKSVLVLSFFVFVFHIVVRMMENNLIGIYVYGVLDLFASGHTPSEETYFYPM